MAHAEAKKKKELNLASSGKLKRGLPTSLMRRPQGTPWKVGAIALGGFPIAEQETPKHKRGATTRFQNLKSRSGRERTDEGRNQDVTTLSLIG